MPVLPFRPPHVLTALLAMALLVSGAAQGWAGGRAKAGAPGAYFVEFRALGNTISGHTMVLTGYRTRSGVVRYTSRNGFFAHGGPFVLLGGIAAPGKVGFRKGMDENRAIKVRFRAPVTSAAYRRVRAHIARQRRNPGAFSLLFRNCNDFAAAVAGAAGLRVPDSRLRSAASFVRALRRMNSRKRRAR